jgi:hypothetical protein
LKVKFILLCFHCIFLVISCIPDTNLFDKFAKGIHPIHSSEAGLPLSSQDCITCQTKEYLSWKESAHANSYTNPLFQSAYAIKHREWCRNCHAPLFDPSLEVKETNNQIALDEGVNCIVCHGSNGKIASSNLFSFQTENHNCFYNSQLKKSEFCANCHEFNFPISHHPDFQYGDVQMQSTYSEWLKSFNSFNNKNCQDCHFKNQDHNSISIKRDISKIINLSIQTKKEFDNASYQINFLIEINKIGHDFPTGIFSENL